MYSGDLKAIPVPLVLAEELIDFDIISQYFICFNEATEISKMLKSLVKNELK